MYRRIIILILICCFVAVASENISASTETFLHFNGSYMDIHSPQSAGGLYDAGGGAALGLGLRMYKPNEFIIWFEYGRSRSNSYIDGNRVKLDMYSLFLDFVLRVPPSRRSTFIPYFHVGAGISNAGFLGRIHAYNADYGIIDQTDLILRLGIGIEIETHRRLSVRLGIDGTSYTGALVGRNEYNDFGFGYRRFKIGLIYKFHKN